MDIIKAPAKILNTKCENIDFNGSVPTQSTIETMFKIMRDCGGIGLAAPQVNIPLRFFIFRNIVVINPEISERSDKKIICSEGCLSIDNITVPVLRHEEIKVHYKSLDNISSYVTLSGVDSIIFQHEYDHLDGILISDRFAELFRYTE